MNEQKYKAEFKDMYFKNEAEFNIWLKTFTAITVKFVDRGQDLLTMYLDKGGEVLHCNLQARVWNGKIVDLNRLKKGSALGFIDVEKQATSLTDFIVEEVKREKHLTKTSSKKKGVEMTM